MSVIRRLILAALCLPFAAPARGQIPAELVERSPPQLAGDAFASNYGLAIVAEFGRILRASADAECLKSKALDAERLTERGRVTLLRHGARMLAIYGTLFDTARYEAVLAERAGPKAKAEILRLRADPEVKRLLALYEPAKLAAIVDNVAETIDRYALIARIRLARQLSPLATGNAELLGANPTDRSVEEVERFLKGRKSAALKRWLELEQASHDAATRSSDRDAIQRLGPRQLAEGLDADLAELCIGAR